MPARRSSSSSYLVFIPSSSSFFILPLRFDGRGIGRGCAGLSEEGLEGEEGGAWGEGVCR